MDGENLSSAALLDLLDARFPPLAFLISICGHPS